jgi:4-hydroxythreonine-4-phosphate dehydrogenase
MMLSGGGLRVGLATVHLSLKEAAAQLSGDAIIQNARVMDGALKCDFGIKDPRISLTGLNPHAGENGSLGTEEDDIINPAARVLRQDGINATDAQPADTLFHAEARQAYDAVLAMYHDQGLIPVKTLDFHGGVNITLGLPIVRTSPDHGTAFNIAGQNKARPDSLIAAIKTAREIANNRKAYLHG